MDSFVKDCLCSIAGIMGMTLIFIFLLVCMAKFL